jgi:hypothetical protein
MDGEGLATQQPLAPFVYPDFTQELLRRSRHSIAIGLRAVAWRGRATIRHSSDHETVDRQGSVFSIY